MSVVKVVTPPTQLPLSSTEAKDQLYIDAATDDTLIDGYLLAAQEVIEAEEWPGIDAALLTQTLDVYFDAFPAQGEPILVPRAPLQSVTSLTYYDSAGTLKTVASSDYEVDTASIHGRVAMKPGKSWPTDQLRALNAVILRIVAGYVDASKIPQGPKLGMLLIVGHLYLNREATATQLPREIQFGVDTFVRRFRGPGFA